MQIWNAAPSTGEVDSNDQRPALRHGASRSPGMLRREAFSPGLRSWHTSQLLKDRDSEETDPRVELRAGIQTLLFLVEIAVIIPLSKRNLERSSHSPLLPSSSTLHWCPVLAP